MNFREGNAEQCQERLPILTLVKIKTHPMIIVKLCTVDEIGEISDCAKFH